MSDDAIGCVGTIILGIFVFIFLFFVHFSTVGKGEHTGYVTAVDKTWLFQNNTVYFKTDTSSSQEDEYCASRDDVELVNKLKEASRAKTLVTISYHGVRAIGIGMCTGAQIDGVK